MTNATPTSTRIRRFMTGIRWLLVVPAAFAGWYIALLVSILIYQAVQRFCPPMHVVSDQCVAPWHAAFFSALVVAGASLAAALIVLLPALVAPARKILVARLAFVAGLACALWLVFSDTEGKSLVNPALIGACLAGAIATGWVGHRLRDREVG